MSEEHEILTLFRKVQLDLRAAVAKMAELQRMVAALELPDASDCECQKCGAWFRGPLKLAEHDYHSHEGAVPPHWVRAEELADEPAEV